jgi:hypothetical protein
MSKLGQLLGDDYEKHRLSILTRTFQFGEATLKVKVPNVSQIEAIYNHFKNPDQVAIEKIYQNLTINLKTFEGDVVTKTDNDVLVNDRSMREAAKNTYLTQFRILEYFKFLVPQEGQDVNTLTYADIDADIPLSIQLQIVDKINEVISPDYKDIRSK